MFTMTNFGGNEKIVKNCESIIEIGGTQLRIEDYNTGFYCRILPQAGNNEFALAEAGVSPKGFLSDMYNFQETYAGEKLTISQKSKNRKLYRGIIDSISGMVLTLEEVNDLLENVFLHMLSQKGIEISSDDGFSVLMKAEEIYNEIEDEGNIGYSEVLEEIQTKLDDDKVSNQDKQILEAIRGVYQNDMFAQVRKNSKLLQEEQEHRKADFKEPKHSQEEIAEDLKDIARSSITENAMKEIVGNTYYILGTLYTEEEIIEGLNEDSWHYGDLIDVIRVNKNIRSIVLEKLNNCDEEDRTYYASLIEEIKSLSESDKDKGEG